MKQTLLGQLQTIPRNKDLYDYHLYGDGDEIAGRRKDAKIDEIAGGGAPNLYPMVHCHYRSVRE